jgi:hypothetical protein
MKIFDEIDLFWERVENSITQGRRREKIRIYLEGLRTKIQQSFFALENLKNLSLKDDSTTTLTQRPVLDYFEQVAFYCDSFCVFLYSCLDILSQIVNQVLVIEPDERKVGFYSIKQYLNRNNSGNQIEVLFNKIFNSIAFKNLYKYRNCSLHRRHIYLQQAPGPIRGSRGYPFSTTQDNISPGVIRKLCDDPYSMRPKVDQNRLVPDYLEGMQKNLLIKMESIIKKIL